MSSAQSPRDSSSTPDASQSASSLGLLRRLTELLAQADDPRLVYEAALDVLRRGLRVDRASVLTFDDAGVARFRAWAGLSEEYRRAVDGHCPWSRGEMGARPLLVRDVREAADLAGYAEIFARE